MTTRTKILLGLGVMSVFTIFGLAAVVSTSLDPVQQVKTEVVAPVVTPVDDEYVYEKDIVKEVPVVVARKRPQECIDGGLTEYECGFWERAQKRIAEGPTWSGDQFEQNRRDAFAKDGGGNYIQK